MISILMLPFVSILQLIALLWLSYEYPSSNEKYWKRFFLGSAGMHVADNSVISDGGLAMPARWNTVHSAHASKVDKDRIGQWSLSLGLLTYLFYAMIQIHKQIIGSDVNNYMVIIFFISIKILRFVSNKLLRNKQVE